MNFLQQFLESEIMDQETYKTIYDFITLDNFRSGEYEGNQYVIRKINRQYIQIEDEVAFENTGLRRVETYTPQHLAKAMTAYIEK